MSKLFDGMRIKSLALANRFVRSATWEGLAEDDGAVTPKLIETMVRLAEGGVGLIISGHAYIRPEGKATPRQLGVYDDRLIDGLRQMTAAVHDNGGRIVLQMAHAGNFAAEAFIDEAPLVASDFEGLAKSPRRQMQTADIHELADAFGAAAERAAAAGFDGVQIHAAHGYLLSQFLSPKFNRRVDEYGGTIQNRSRIHREVYKAVRKSVGQEFPVMIKMNGRDFSTDDFPLEDAVTVAKMLADAGMDAIEVSGGLLTSLKRSPSRVGITSVDKEAYFKEEARAIKQEIDIPLILVGGIRSFEVAEEMVNTGTADFISMSRPFIREPDLINRWKTGDRRPADCKSDNLCFKPGFEGSGVYCLARERENSR